MRQNSWLSKMKESAKKLKKEISVLFIAYRKKETPILAKVVALLVVSYALSPIDLIPDFIPILGYLDDIILLPLLIKLAITLIPKDILDQCREDVEAKALKGSTESKIGLAIVIALWTLFILIIFVRLFR